MPLCSGGIRGSRRSRGSRSGKGCWGTIDSRQFGKLE